MVARCEESFTAKAEFEGVQHFEELLADPLAQIMMRHDGTDAETVRHIMLEAAQRIAQGTRRFETEAA